MVLAVLLGQPTGTPLKEKTVVMSKHDFEEKVLLRSPGVSVRYGGCLEITGDVTVAKFGSQVRVSGVYSMSQ